MKKLFLIRHAKSDWGNSDLSDSERPLNKRGKHNAPLMAKLLKKADIIPDIIYSSPAIRALTTAGIFADAFEYQKNKIVIDENIYESSIGGLETIVQNISDEYTTVFLFGHNPTITYFANHVGNKIIDNMPTCSIAGVKFDMNSWKDVERGTGNTFYFEYPKKHFT